MMHDVTNAADDAELLALRALGWLIGEPARAERFLALTGLDVATLRARAGDPVILRAVIDHIAAHEPDLVACATALAIDPAALVRARDVLESSCGPC